MTQLVLGTLRGKRERRFRVDQPALVAAAAAPDLVFTARIADVSRRGMLLVLDQAADLGGEVCIRWKEDLKGTIRHSEEVDGEYRVGVELETGRRSLLLEMMAQDNQHLQEALAAAARTSVIKSRFLASLRNEFLTPLNGIMGFAELLFDAKVGPVTDDQRDCLEDILICSRHLLTLINQVLDLTKIESGKMDFEYTLVDLGTLAHETMEGVKGLAARKGIALRLECDEGVGPVEADAARLRQVLFNYLSNALKFTAEGGRVVVRTGGDEPGYYRVEVEDNGIGIEPRDMGRLFSEFSRLGAARKEGSGLGLAITRQIVEGQGGAGRSG